MKKNIWRELDSIKELWAPKIISEVDDVFVKLAKIHGDFDKHTHIKEDELFYIIKGSVTIVYDDTKVILNEGDIHVLPKGKAHKPVALEECWVLIIENKSTKHTGEIINKYTKSIEQQSHQE